MTFLLSGGAIPVALLGVLVPLGVCVGGARQPHDARRWWRLGAQLLWLAAFVGVGFLTLWLANPNGGGVNLVPFASIERELTRASLSMAVFNLLGNLLVLVPFGLLARPAWGWGVLPTTVAGFLFSTGIEVAQGLTGRTADVDDIMLNTGGAFAGAIVVGLIHLVGRWRLNRGLHHSESRHAIHRSASAKG